MRSSIYLFHGATAAAVLLGLLYGNVGWSDQSEEGQLVRAWEFNTDGDLEGWHPNGHMKDVQVSGGTLKFTVVNWDPFFTTDVFQKPIKATATQVVEIRLKASQGGMAEFFWTNTTQTKYGGFSPGKETKFQVEPGWRVYRVRPFWQGEGKIIKLRFDPPGIHEGTQQPTRYEIDYIRVIELGPSGEPVPPKWTFSRGSEGWRVEGRGALRNEGGWLVAELEKGARLVAPSVNVNAYEDVFVSFVMSVDSGTSGRVLFASQAANGLRAVSFPTIADGKPHVYNVPVALNGGWKGRVIYLALEPATGESCTARIDWLRTSPQPAGPPELELRRFLVPDALPRAGRPCEVLAKIGNRGGQVVKGLVARLHLPDGVRLADGETPVKPVPEVDYYEPVDVSWRVVASRPGRERFLITVSGPASLSGRTTETFLAPLNLPKADYVPKPRPVASDYDIGVYYFPGWWSWTRWRPIMEYPERRPVLGWYKEGSPEVADWHIKFAVEHGIKFFCYDWYWDRGRTRLQHALHEGYFNARYRRLLKFCLLWANHAPTVHTPEDNVKVCQYWIDNYFRRPEYYKINGRPLIVIFSVWAMKRDLGIDGARKAIELWHKMTREAGVGEVLVAGNGRPSQLGEMKQMGFDAVTGYNWPTCGVSPGRNFVPYIEVARRQFDLWWMAMAKRNLMPVITPTSPGWDARPWHGKRAFVQIDRTPQAFEEHLRLAKRFIDMTGQPKVLLIEAWNEFGEGSYCEPHKEYGFGHLDAVRRVFCPGVGGHVDYGPRDVGLGPYDCQPPKQKRTAWEFNTDGDSEGWSAAMGLTGFKIEGGVMEARSTSNDPAFSCGVRFRARNFRTVEVRMALSGSQQKDVAQLFWATTVTATSEPASVRCPAIVDGKMHTYRFDVAANSLWRGVITRLRLDPCATADTQVRIDYIRLLRDAGAQAGE